MVDKSSRLTATAFSIFSSASKRVSSITFAAPPHCALCVVTAVIFAARW
jgi:hypothetical protein